MDDNIHQNTFTDVHEAYNFLRKHPLVYHKELNHFSDCLDIAVVKVNPETNSIGQSPHA